MEQPERRSYTDALRARGLDAGTQVERMQRRYRGEEV
jgi:hypothetical protein